MAIVQQWKIRSRARQCAETGRDFADGEWVYSCIYLDLESDGYLRLDLCEEAWNSRKTSDEPFSQWRSKFEMPPVEEEEKGETVQFGKVEGAEALLHQLEEREDPALDKIRYLVVVMLERKRIFRQVDVKEVNGQRMLIYERAKTGAAMVVPDPNVSLDEIEALQEEVIALLEPGSPEEKPNP